LENKLRKSNESEILEALPRKAPENSFESEILMESLHENQLLELKSLDDRFSEESDIE